MGPFLYYNSAYHPKNYGQLGIWVKYKRAENPAATIRIVRSELGFLHIECPDRELLFTRNSMTTGGARPLNGEWDEYVSYSLCNSVSAGNEKLDRYMINADIAMRNLRMAHPIRKEGSFVRDGKVIMADCFVSNTWMVTDRGIVTIKDIAGNRKGKTPYLGDYGVVTQRGGVNTPKKRFRSEAPAKLIKVALDNGHSVTCSYGQPFLTDRGFVKAKDLKAGADTIHVRFGDRIWSKRDVEFEYDKGVYLERRFSDYPDSVKCPYCGLAYGKIDSHLAFKHKIKVSEVDKEVMPYSMSKKVAISHSEKKVKDILTYPTQMTPQLAEFLGLICADGRLQDDNSWAGVEVNFGVKECLVSRLVFLYKHLFGGSAKVKRIFPEKEPRYSGERGVKPSKGAIYHEVSLPGGRVFMGFLSYIGMPATKSNYKEIPWSVLESKEECVLAFLNGLFSADGSVDSTGLPSIYTSSRKMAKQLPVVLNNLGILTRVYEHSKIRMPETKTSPSKVVSGYGCKINISGMASINQFNRLIPLSHVYKSANQAIKPMSHLAKGRSDAKGVSFFDRKCSKGLYGAKVKKVSRLTAKRHTYDITLSNKEHTYLAGPGIVVHNSGGFQLYSGKSEWIDPIELGRFYRDHCDEGITIDIPHRDDTSDEMHKRGAMVQVNNSKVIRSEAGEGFRLFNVIHGANSEQLRTFRSIVESDPECSDYTCVGGVYHGTMPSAMYRLLDFVMDKDYKPYKQYHILGIYNPAFSACLVWATHLLRKHFRSDITMSCDASTAALIATTRIMNLQRAHYKNAERLTLGKAAPLFKQNPFRLLPCGCPVCDTIKYVDIISHAKECLVAHTFISHNMYEQSRWFDMMNYYASVLSFEDYKKLCFEQMRGAAFQKTCQVTLDLTNTAIIEGLPEAKKQFRSALTTGLTEAAFIPSSGYGLNGDVDVEALAAEYTDEDLAKRIPVLIKRYEDYHITGNTPEVAVKKVEMKRFIKKVQMNNAAAVKHKKKKLLTKAEMEKKKLKVGKSTHKKVAGVARRSSGRMEE